MHRTKIKVACACIISLCVCVYIRCANAGWRCNRYGGGEVSEPPATAHWHLQRQLGTWWWRKDRGWTSISGQAGLRERHPIGGHMHACIHLHIQINVQMNTSLLQPILWLWYSYDYDRYKHTLQEGRYVCVLMKSYPKVLPGSLLVRLLRTLESSPGLLAYIHLHIQSVFCIKTSCRCVVGWVEWKSYNKG